MRRTAVVSPQVEAGGRHRHQGDHHIQQHARLEALVCAHLTITAPALITPPWGHYPGIIFSIQLSAGRGCIKQSGAAVCLFAFKLKSNQTCRQMALCGAAQSFHRTIRCLSD